MVERGCGGNRVIFNVLTIQHKEDKSMTWILGAGAVAVAFTALESQALRNGNFDRADFLHLMGNVILLGGALLLGVHLFNDMSFLHWLR